MLFSASAAQHFTFPMQTKLCPNIYGLCFAYALHFFSYAHLGMPLQNITFPLLCCAILRLNDEMQLRYTACKRHAITVPSHAMPCPNLTMLCLCVEPQSYAMPLHSSSIQSRSNPMLLLFPSLHLRCPASPLLCSAYHCLTELSMPKHHRTLLCRCYTNFSVADHHETSQCHCYAIPHETFPLPHRSKPRLNCPSLLRCSACLHHCRADSTQLNKAVTKQLQAMP